MSPMLTCGNACCAWCALVDGDTETPLARASTAMRKNREVSTAPTASLEKRSSVLPVNQVGNKMAFVRSAFKVPAVR